MYRTILVPLDGSAFAERALPCAQALARATGAQLALVQVVWTPTVAEVGPAVPGTWAATAAEGYLKGLAGKLVADGISADATVRYDRPVEGILAEVERRQPDLIVMATHERPQQGPWAYGSVAEAVLTRGHVPMLLVRGTAAETAPPQNGGVRLLVPLDGSVVAEEALSHAAALGQALDATVLLLRALTISPTRVAGLAFAEPPLSPEVREQYERNEAEAYLQGVSDRLRARGLRVESVVRLAPAAEAIIETNRTTGVWLVIMTTHGRTGVARLLFGSVAAEVLNAGVRVLLLVPPRGLATP